MVNVQLIAYKISRLEMYNVLQSSQEVELKNSSEFDVTFDIENEMATAMLTEHVKMTGFPCDFSIDLTLKGTFHITEVRSDASKKEAHVKCYNGLFPYAGQIISQLAMNSGMNGLILKKKSMESESVNFGSRPEKEKSDKIIEFRA